MSNWILTQEMVEDLKSLALFAEKNPFSMDNLLDIYNKQAKPAGDQKEFVRFLPFGYKVVFSIEDQVKGKVRHLSISIDKDGALSSIQSVKAVMEVLGFEGGLEDCIVYPEKVTETKEAINVLQIIK